MAVVAWQNLVVVAQLSFRHVKFSVKMGLCAGETAKKKKAFKTIIIPKGVINPNENNVIEIPIHLDTNSSLIVKGPADSKACLVVEPYSPGLSDNQPQPQLQPQLPTQDAFYPSNNSKISLPMTYIEIPVVESHRRTIPLEAAIPMRTTDLGVQTSLATLQSTPTYQSTSMYQADNAHSPMCPICAKASCRYVRPYSNYFSEITPKFISSPKPKPLDASYFCRGYDSSMERARSEIIPRSAQYSTKYLDENSLLTKILDDKIERLLKPILLSLARSIPDEEEREISPRNSYGSRYSREPRQQSLFDSYLYQNPRIHFESSRRSSEPTDYYNDRSRLKQESSYERFRRGAMLKDEDRFSESERYSRRYSDEDFSRKRRPRNTGREYALDGNMERPKKVCNTTSGCEKRANANVYFEPWQDLPATSSQLSEDSYELNRRLNERTAMDHSFDKNDLNKSFLR